MDKHRVAAIIQARMGSSRLPGKVLLPLSGKPVLWHIIHRLRQCRTVNVIAIATSDKSSDDPLVEFARMEGVELVRGPEENVLQRFSLAAVQLDPDIIVRVTGDAPLIDPGTLDHLVETLVGEGAEYCMGEKGVDSINEGFCTFTRAALNRLLSEAAEDPVAVEHVTAYFKEHPESFRIAQIPIPPEHKFTGARISVDTPADLRFIEELYHRLAVPAGEADIVEVVKLLRNCPELLEINKHIYQKKATDRSVKAIIRCDGDSVIGLGHVVRCLALADELREKHGCGITFAMASGEPGKALVREKGFPIIAKPTDSDEGGWLDDLMKQQHPDILLLDVRSDLPRDKIRTYRQNGVLIVTIDDPSDRRLEADLAFYPPVPQVDKLEWLGFPGELHIGWEWVILRSQFARKPSQAPKNIMPTVLVGMGGSDPGGLTLKTIRALNNLTFPFRTVLIIGKGFPHWNELQLLLEHSPCSFDIRVDVTDIAALMDDATVAVAAYGMTAFELAARRIPSILLALTEDHAEAAELFVQAGIAKCLGVAEHVQEKAISDALADLLSDTRLLGDMAASASQCVDGLGAQRVAKQIMTTFNTKCPMPENTDE